MKGVSADDDLSDGDIAGIVIGSVFGGLLLIACVLALLGICIWFVFTKVCGGDGSFASSASGKQESPFMKD